MSAYLHPIADREPLRWIVAGQRTALPAHRARDAAKLCAGDTLLLYTSRGCFRNPTRDRGRVMGLASLSDSAESLDPPVTFGGRAYPLGVSLRIELLAPPREGVELAPLVGELDGFPDGEGWSAHLRRALVPLSEAAAARLEAELRAVAGPYANVRAAYAA